MHADHAVHKFLVGLICTRSCFTGFLFISFCSCNIDGHVVVLRQVLRNTQELSPNTCYATAHIPHYQSSCPILPILTSHTANPHVLTFHTTNPHIPHNQSSYSTQPILTPHTTNLHSPGFMPKSSVAQDGMRFQLSN